MQLIVGELRPAVVRRTLKNFDIRRPQVSVGRALIALAQLTIIALTPYDALMQSVLGQHPGPNCAGIRAASVYCLAAEFPSWIPTVVMSVILVAVVLGIFPPVTSLLHLWVSFSIAVSIMVPDGGDQAAVAIGIPLVFVSLADNRIWALQKRSRPVSSVRRQMAYAGSLMMRVQMATIYFCAAVGKMFAEYWMNGTEEYYVLKDPYFGTSGLMASLAEFVTDSSIVVVALTWGAVLLELCIGVLLLCGPKARSIAVLLAVALHGFIILTIGLWSFGLIMIGAVVLAAAPVTAQEARRSVIRAVSSRRPTAIDDRSEPGDFQANEEARRNELATQTS